MDNLFATLFPFVDFLYILQLCDYDNNHYLQWIIPRVLKRHLQLVGAITWTKKVRFLLGTTLFLYVSLIWLTSLAIDNYIVLFLVLLLYTVAIPVLVLGANMLVKPVDSYLKKGKSEQAAQKLKTMPKLLVVAIAGSHGKTSIRNFVYQLLKDKVNVHTPQQNYNTLLSISEDILANVNNKTQVYVVEFGEYQPGDLQQFEQLLHPYLVALTSIGTQHQAQFASEDALAHEFTNFVNNTSAETVIVNEFDHGIQKYDDAINQKVERVSEHHGKMSHHDLPEYMEQNFYFAKWIASHITDRLGIDADFSKATEFTATPQRMHITTKNDITIIDDSYNINPQSAKAALDFLNTKKGRKILVTGGIVEQGKAEANVNTDYGTQIAQTVDVVVVAQNNLAVYIASGIAKEAKKIEVIASPHPSKTPDILQQLLKKGDIVLVQNELPDLYWH